MSGEEGRWARQVANERLIREFNFAEYRSAHRSPHSFIVHPDHFTPHIERIIERHPDYLVVEKLPAYQGADPTSG